RPLLERMLRAVAFDEMPRKPAMLALERRRAIVRALIEMLYADGPARDAAHQVFELATRWRSPLPEAARLAAVHGHAGVPDAAWPTLDGAYYGTDPPVQ